VTNLPESRLRHDAMKPAGPFLRITGLDQDWHVFAPDPRQTSIRLEARIRYDDGSGATWRPPAGGDLVGAYWDYRWRKLVENTIQDANRKVLWRPAALFAAGQLETTDRRPASVALVRRWQDLRPPGAAATHAVGWHRYAFYKQELP
jgi:Family of unknown function (DUF5819)